MVHQDVERFRGKFEYMIIDAPPSLSEMTESVLRACDTALIPMRPSLPDVWALPWLAAIINKLRKEGKVLESLAVFNQYKGEALEGFTEEITPWHIPVHEETLPMDPSFAAVYEGHPLPGPIAELVLGLVQAHPAAPRG